VLNLEKEERGPSPSDAARLSFDKVHFASLQPRSLLALNLTRRGKTKVPLQSPPTTSNVCVCVCRGEEEEEGGGGRRFFMRSPCVSEWASLTLAAAVFRRERRRKKERRRWTATSGKV
jgi:hypothetical protein